MHNLIYLFIFLCSVPTVFRCFRDWFLRMCINTILYITKCATLNSVSLLSLCCGCWWRAGGRVVVQCWAGLQTVHSVCIGSGQRLAQSLLSPPAERSAAQHSHRQHSSLKQPSRINVKFQAGLQWRNLCKMGCRHLIR